MDRYPQLSRYLWATSGPRIETAPHHPITKMAEYGADGLVTVDFIGKVAVMTLKCGQNRFNKSMVEKIGRALDKVER